MQDLRCHDLLGFPGKVWPNRSPRPPATRQKQVLLSCSMPWRGPFSVSMQFAGFFKWETKKSSSKKTREHQGSTKENHLEMYHAETLRGNMVCPLPCETSQILPREMEGPSVPSARTPRSSQIPALSHLQCGDFEFVVGFAQLCVR